MGGTSVFSHKAFNGLNKAYTLHITHYVEYSALLKVYDLLINVNHTLKTPSQHHQDWYLTK